MTRVLHPALAPLLTTWLLLPGLLPAADWYASEKGVDSQPGSKELPFRQIRAAIAVARPGDSILVSDGSYLGFDLVSFAGTASAGLTIRALGGKAVVTVTTDRPDNRDTIFISHCSHVVIEGLQAYKGNRSGMRVDGCENVTVEGCIFGDNRTWGIFTDFSNNLLIQDNECYGSVEQHGCYVSNTCTGPVVRGNLLHDNAQCGLHMNGDIHQGGVGIITNALIEDNIIYNNGARGGSGINCDGVVHSVFQDNLVFNEHASGMSLYRIDASAPSTDDEVIGNTFDVAGDGRWALNIGNGSTGALVYDNILVNHNARHGSICFDSEASMAGLHCDGNVLSAAGAVATTNGGDAVLSLAQWQALGFDEHSQTASQDSLFTDWNAGDYSLLTGCPAVGAGAGVFRKVRAPILDIVGEPRPGPQGYSVGAYEVPTPGHRAHRHPAHQALQP